METQMIPFDEAYDIVINAARALPAENVGIAAAFKRVLAQDVRADVDMPPFDKAMVDGYACRREDLALDLKSIETIPAGYEPQCEIGPGDCAKIMTGAMVPKGADCVFMVEHSHQEEHGPVMFIGEKTGDNIVPRAHDIREGEVLLKAGHRLLAPEVAVLASMGCAKPKVARRPRVAVIATGDELVEASETPSVSQIRNSNGYQLCAQIEAMGAEAYYGGIARDSEQALNRAVGLAIAENDVVILSGGVSMGEFDLVPGVLTQNGIDLKFEKVAIQPGKPTVFGYSEDAFCFGLPGNPVSTFSTFELLVKPFLFKLMGHDYAPPSVFAPLEATITRNVSERKAWVPVRLTETGHAIRVEYHGSAHVNALCHADGLVAFPIGVSTMEMGTVVSVRLIRD